MFPVMAGSAWDSTPLIITCKEKKKHNDPLVYTQQAHKYEIRYGLNEGCRNHVFELFSLSLDHLFSYSNDLFCLNKLSADIGLSQVYRYRHTGSPIHADVRNMREDHF